MSEADDRGAVAVEMALLLPALILILLGIMEFGRAYNAQVTLTNAAREGVRVMAITGNQVDAKDAAVDAAPALNPEIDATNIAVEACTAGAQVTFTITYQLDTLTGFAGPFTLTGKGVMRCGG